MFCASRKAAIRCCTLPASPLCGRSDSGNSASGSFLPPQPAAAAALAGPCATSRPDRSTHSPLSFGLRGFPLPRRFERLNRTCAARSDTSDHRTSDSSQLLPSTAAPLRVHRLHSLS